MSSTGCFLSPNCPGPCRGKGPHEEARKYSQLGEDVQTKFVRENCSMCDMCFRMSIMFGVPIPLDNEDAELEYNEKFSTRLR